MMTAQRLRSPYAYREQEASGDMDRITPALQHALPSAAAGNKAAKGASVLPALARSSPGEPPIVGTVAEGDPSSVSPRLCRSDLSLSFPRPSLRASQAPARAQCFERLLVPLTRKNLALWAYQHLASDRRPWGVGSGDPAEGGVGR